MSLAAIFERHKGLVAHKFPHHLEIYDTIFERFRFKPDLCLLEIGICEGGSLQLWREYFNSKAAIIGVDIQDKTNLAGETNAKIMVGDQGDRNFWAMAKPQIGNPHIIIDDGSHMCADQLMTFHELFPILQDGGLYVIEDIHTSYREAYGGGLYHPASFVEYLKRAIDVMHASEFGGKADSHIFSVQVYPNLAVIEKRNPNTWGGSTMRPA